MTRVVVVGSGINGLAAALTCARRGMPVHVIESSTTLGGSSRTLELTEPGFRHDVGAAVHPLLLRSPFFVENGLAEDVPFVSPDLAYAHAIRPGMSALAYRSLERTVDGLGRAGGAAWRLMFEALSAGPDRLAAATLGPQPWRASRLQLPLAMSVARAYGRLPESAGALLGGLMAHAPGQGRYSASARLVGLTLGAYAHADGWLLPVGGSQAIVDALVRRLQGLGVTFELDRTIDSLDELGSPELTFLDTTPWEFVRLSGPRLSAKAARPYVSFAPGPGTAKIDLALDGPLPWADPALADAGVVHIGGTLQELTRSEARLGDPATVPSSPYVLLSQPSRFDQTRAPHGRHTVWAYAHVPNGWRGDVVELVMGEVERYAPGARDRVRTVAGWSPADLADSNRNLVGGDISGGGLGLRQLFVRPTALSPWRTPVRGVYLCSSSTRPGPGVHGMCGYNAASQALTDIHELAQVRTRTSQ